MNISGMRPYEGFYEYNSIKAVALRSQQIAAVQNASGDEELSGGSQPQGQTQTKRPQTYNAFDYAKEYQPDETYEHQFDINNISIFKQKHTHMSFYIFILC